MSRCTGHCCERLAIQAMGWPDSLDVLREFVLEHPGNDVFYHLDDGRDIFLGAADAVTIVDMLEPLGMQPASDGVETMFYTCNRHNPETRLCTRYDERPAMCRNYGVMVPCEHGCGMGCATPESRDTTGPDIDAGQDKSTFCDTMKGAP